MSRSLVRFANGGRLTLEDLALIEAIRAERSILAASRATGVSYRSGTRSSRLLNRCWRQLRAGPARNGGGVYAFEPSGRGRDFADRR
jgi:molybdate transport system regulatory protein